MEHACGMITRPTLSCPLPHPLGRVVTLRGTVVRSGVTRPLATSMDFACGKCGGRVPALFPEGKFTPPTRCSEAGCRGKAFAPNRSSAKCRDWKKIRVQELVGVDKKQAGQVGGGAGGCWG